MAAKGVSYSINLDATQAVIRLNGIADALPKALDAWLVDSAELAQGWMQRNVSEGVTGKLKRSIDIDYERATHTAKVGPSADYAIYVEKGTGPHMPPVDAIAPWAEMHGLNPWAVAMGIKKKGTKAHPFFEPTVTEVSPIIMARAEAAFIGAVGE